MGRNKHKLTFSCAIISFTEQCSTAFYISSFVHKSLLSNSQLNLNLIATGTVAENAFC